MSKYQIGWGRGDITPKGEPVSLVGQFHVRITEEIHDPLYAMCMVVKSEEAASVWVSIDACWVFKISCDEIEARLEKEIPGFKPGMLMMNATHIHTGPSQNYTGGWLSLTGDVIEEPGVMTGETYRKQLADGVVAAVKQAWYSAVDSEIELAIAPVITGVNRRTTYKDGSAKMYGPTHGDDFYRMEHRDGGPTQLMYVYTAAEHKLTGVVVNVPCTAQCDEFAYYVTADYWGVVRERLAKSFGEDVIILSLCRAAGDLSPHPMVDLIAGEEDKTHNRPNVEYMGNWIADVVELFKNRPLRTLAGETHKHLAEDIELPMWPVTEQEYIDAKAYMADPSHFNEEGKPLEAFNFANAWTRIRRVERDPKVVTTRIAATRLDEVVLLSVPFELYIAYADRIRMAVPTAIVFDVELAYDSLGYLPTKEAVAGGHYSTNIFNGVCDPSGGDVLVEKCVEIIRKLL